MNKNHVISGIRWTLVTSVIRRLITLVLFYFIARWLSKEDLGIFRTYSLLLALMSVIGCYSVDFHYVIEQRRIKTGLTALWQITILSAVLIFVLLTFSASLIGNFYNSKELTVLFKYASVCVIIEILRRAVRSMTSKALKFRELALAETYNVIFYSLTALIVLFFRRSLYLYVTIFYLGNLLETLYLWQVNKKSIHQALRHAVTKTGLWLKTLKLYKVFFTQATLVSVINQISGNAPILILGMFIEPLYLGLYFFASQLIGVPVGMFTTAINQVFFPVFSGKKDGDIQSMTLRYLRLIGYIGLPLLLLYCFILMYGVGWLWGSKWKDAIPLIPLMFIISGTSLYSNPIGGIPFIKRKPNWELIWNVFAFIIKVGAMLAGLSYSFLTAIFAYAVASALMSISFYVMSMYLLKANLLKTLGEIVISICPVLIYTIYLYMISVLMPWQAIVLAIVGCSVVMVGINYLQKGRLWTDIRLLIINK